jgi:hypothetical protein
VRGPPSGDALEALIDSLSSRHLLLVLVFGQVALAVAAVDASSGPAGLSKAPLAEPACAVPASGAD